DLARVGDVPQSRRLTVGTGHGNEQCLRDRPHLVGGPRGADDDAVLADRPGRGGGRGQGHAAALLTEMGYSSSAARTTTCAFTPPARKADRPAVRGPGAVQRWTSCCKWKGLPSRASCGFGGSACNVGTSSRYRSCSTNLA